MAVLTTVLPEWLWIIIVGAVVIGLIRYVWYLKDRQADERFKSLEGWKEGTIKEGGVLTKQCHEGLCEEVTDKMKVDLTVFGKDMKESITQGFAAHKQWVEVKFENIDDKIENKILKELQKINGNSDRKYPRKKGVGRR